MICGVVESSYHGGGRAADGLSDLFVGIIDMIYFLQFDHILTNNIHIPLSSPLTTYTEVLKTHLILNYNI